MNDDRRDGRLHIVMCAGACHPDIGSEFAVGWQWATAAAKQHRVTVITGDVHGSADAIRRRLEADPELSRNLSFRFLPWFDPPRSKTLEKLWRTVPPIYYWHYRRWLRQAADTACRVIEEEPVDLVHQVTYIGYREPGFLWQLGVPFVWGPVGGTQDIPWAFLPSLGVYDGCRHAARNLINRWDFWMRRDVKSAMNAAVAISAVASDTQSAIQRRFGRQSVVVPATSCSDLEKPHERKRLSGATRFVFSGLHIARKGLPYALTALATMKTEDWILDVLGSGPLTKKWKRQADDLGISDRLVFHGRLSRAEAVRVMARADAFVFPSLQEGWPTVVIEALSLGLPVVAPRHHGMADMIDETSGFPLRVDKPSNLIADLTAALRVLIADPSQRERLSLGALARAAHLNRDRQVAAIANLYTTALARSETDMSPTSIRT